MTTKNAGKLNMAALKAAAGTYKLKLPKGDPVKAAEILEGFFDQDEDLKAKLATCTQCGYASPDDLDSCPFCGVVLGAATSAGGETPAPAKAPRKPAKKGERPPKPQKEPEPPPTPEMIQACKEHVDEIKTLRRDLAQNAYDIGVHLREIHDGNLWKAVEGKSFKSFSEFCASELDYTRVMAYKYMTMARELPRDVALQLGVSKSEIVTNAPEKHRKKLLEQAQRGATRTELLKNLAKLEGKAPPGSRGKADEGAGKITLLTRVKEGDQFVEWVNPKTGKPTSRDTKSKCAVFQLTSDVKLSIVEHEEGKGLILSFSKVE